MSTETPDDSAQEKRKGKQRSVISLPSDAQRLDISSALQDLKPKTLTLQELLREYLEVIETVKKTGITWGQIAQVFNDILGVNIGADSFQRAYMALNKTLKKQRMNVNHIQA